MVHEKAAEMVTRILGQEMRDIGDVRDPVQKLKQMIEKELETIDRYQDLILTIYQESHSLSKPSLRTMLRSEEVHVGMFKEVIERGIKLGVFREANPLLLANMIKMMIDCWVLKRWNFRGKVNLEEMKQGILNMVQRGIVLKEKA